MCRNRIFFYKDGVYIRANTAAAICGVAAGIIVGAIAVSTLSAMPIVATAIGFSLGYYISNKVSNCVYNNFNSFDSISILK